MPSTATTCAEHKDRLAGWSCPGCPRVLCPECAVLKKAGTSSVVVCRHCGELARPILVPRASTPYSRLVWEAFAYPFSSKGILILLAAGFVLNLLEYVGVIGRLLSAGATFSLLFLIVRTTSLGHHDVPETEDVSGGELLAPLAKGLLAVVVPFLPTIAYFVYFGLRLAGPGDDPVDTVAQATSFLTDPLFYLSGVAGVLWGPAALMLAATHSPFTTILNPLATWRIVHAAPSSYLLATGLFWALFAGDWAVSLVGSGFVEMVPVPILAPALVKAMTLYLPVVSARVLGLLLYVHGAEIGYGRQEDFFVPALGDTRPTGEASPAPTAEAKPAPSTEPAPPAAAGHERAPPLPTTEASPDQSWSPVPTEAPRLPELPDLSLPDAPLPALPPLPPAEPAWPEPSEQPAVVEGGETLAGGKRRA